MSRIEFWPLQQAACKIAREEIRSLKVYFLIDSAQSGAFSTIAMPELVPIRLAPARIIAAAVGQSLIPPLAFTPICRPTVLRIKVTSSSVAPPLKKPVLVLT